MEGRQVGRVLRLQAAGGPLAGSLEVGGPWLGEMRVICLQKADYPPAELCPKVVIKIFAGEIRTEYPSIQLKLHSWAPVFAKLGLVERC